MFVWAKRACLLVILVDTMTRDEQAKPAAPTVVEALEGYNTNGTKIGDDGHGH